MLLTHVEDLKVGMTDNKAHIRRKHILGLVLYRVLVGLCGSFHQSPLRCARFRVEKGPSSHTLMANEIPCQNRVRNIWGTFMGLTPNFKCASMVSIMLDQLEADTILFVVESPFFLLLS